MLGAIAGGLPFFFLLVVAASLGVFLLPRRAPEGDHPGAPDTFGAVPTPSYTPTVPRPSPSPVDGDAPTLH